MRALARSLSAAAAVMLLAAGCGGAADGADGAEDNVSLQVYAAASLQEPFTELGEAFEAEHDGVDVEFNFAGSSTLVQQIQQGAPADVFASANPENMDKLVEAGMQSAEPVDFTSNTLMIAVPAGNPAEVTDLTSLTEEDLHLVVCAPEVPCGAATETVEQAAGLAFTPVSEEQSVTDVLNKVTSGEADAGLVYVTDVTKAGDAVEGIGFPEAQEAVNVYPITSVKDSAHLELAKEFVDLVSGPTGQQILDGYGFVGL
ncbi:molybdate ABC transporter substrate-binding protein [Brachybacterium avium]|uniref:Molybdate-binding protein ModA n=1 Tax=Brachybacterium avium TaxID=2017485 RepID=A0A220U9Z4_9MICO|nr:molybdate ABC transporter substrate-binding protein [Brachybacterium avium]ASK64726.1 molybdate ABC transporter substrate-binding protein [Brachybacterium avium]